MLISVKEAGRLIQVLKYGTLPQDTGSGRRSAWVFSSPQSSGSLSSREDHEAPSDSVESLKNHIN